MTYGIEFKFLHLRLAGSVHIHFACPKKEVGVIFDFLDLDSHHFNKQLLGGDMGHLQIPVGVAVQHQAVFNAFGQRRHQPPRMVR